MVTLPYNLLLQPSARNALGIDLQDHVIIIDEAHSKPSLLRSGPVYCFLTVYRTPDLISTILSLSTVPVTYQNLKDSLDQISTYLSKFRLRLSSRHMLHLTRLYAFLKALMGFVFEWRSQQKLGSERHVVVMTVSEVMQALGQNIDAVNLLEIYEYLRTSKVMAIYLSHFGIVLTFNRLLVRFQLTQHNLSIVKGKKVSFSFLFVDTYTPY